MQKPGFMECIMGFSTFFSNMGNSGTDANIADEDSVFKAICRYVYMAIKKLEAFQKCLWLI
jgi:hypothetical protein